MPDFIYRIIDNCLYTTLSGSIINYIIDFFFADEKKLKGILKREKDNLIILNYEISQLIKNIKKRSLYFIIIAFFLTIITWYYVSCFNNIYPNLNIEWIESSLIIIFVMQILPIIISLLDTIVRYASFKCKNEKIFRISRCLS